MTKYALYQQLPPVSLDSEWHARLIRAGTVYAQSPEDAIKRAYDMQVFANAHGGARFPLVEPA